MRFSICASYCTLSKKRLKATTIDENFRTFLASKRSSGVREKTILSYQQAYQAVNRHCPIGEMDMTAFHADTLNALIEALLRANLSRNSIHTYTVALASFFNWCKTEGISRYTFKPYKGEETVKTPYTDAELKLLLKKPNLRRCDFSEYRTWVIINLLLNCGCRASTIRGFHIQDLDLENRLLFARHVKNNRPQPLPLCSDMVAILQEYLTYREGKAHEPLFPSDADQPMTENGLRCSVANYNRKRGVEKTSNLMQLIAPGAPETGAGAAQTAVPAQTGGAPNAVEELKQYKSLLDAGVITEEEFAAKKRQLLGI